MFLFISYAREQHPQAQILAARLRAAGHRVFFDEKSLAPGQPFDTALVRAIRSCDLFLFLISPDSVDRGYALTELGLAEERWPNPADHVLPVQLAEAPLPAYLSALKVLRPRGDLPAEVVHVVADLAARRRRRHLWFGGLGAAGAGLLVTGTLLWLPHPADSADRTSDPRRDASVERGPAASSDAGPLQRNAGPRDAGPDRSSRDAGKAVTDARISPPGRRLFPLTRICRVSLEAESDGWWLACRCPAGRAGPQSFRFADLSFAGNKTEQLWRKAAAFAEDTNWRCP